MIEADPHLESLVVDKEGRRETKVQSATIFEGQEEFKFEGEKEEINQFNSPL